MVEHSLLVSFEDQSPPFVHGFEAGIIWQQIQAGDRLEVEVTTHVENRETIARMAVVAGWGIEVTATEVEGWDHTILRKDRQASARPNPMGLRLVPAKEGR